VELNWPDRPLSGVTGLPRSSRPHEVEPPIDVGVLFATYGMQLLRYCRGRLRLADAEDVVAQTFLIAQRRRLDQPADFPSRAWLFGIATNVLREHRRAEMRRLRAMSRVGSEPRHDLADAVVEQMDGAAALRPVLQAMAKLPARQREVLLLYAVAELSYDEIAEALHMPLGSVRSNLHRARGKIRAAVGKERAVSDEQAR
jgi:RNA polymerase sigma factor (sigma-70 family)